jgi:hypothetical protein
MSDRPDINAIFDRIANRNATDGDIQTLRQSVAIGGNAQGATIVTGDDNILGDNNTVQIGKYNINIAEGINIKVGDTIYQGAGAEMIRAMLLEVLTDKIVIDSTFLRLFGKSESSGVDWDWGMKLLKQKQLPEIRKRLTDTLGRDRILMDVSIEERQNWVNRSPLAADRILQINGEDCGRLDANKMLIETFGRDDIEGKLLILGAPGAGKTTALLSLAEQLVYGAISQPKTVIPVIFELSTWRNDNQSIQDWLIEQLYDLHGGNRKSKLYEQWLERQVLLPLLDGLDELGLERQQRCTEKLNEFAVDYPQMVVCCRVREFEAVGIRLRNLRGAVCLQSLSDSQIQNYLGSLKRPELWEAIQTTPSLQAMLEPTTDGDPGLLRVPLFVKLVADVYDRQQPISSKADLLDQYINRQLSFDKREIDRRKELNEYKWAYKTAKLEPDWKKVHNNLNWLARNLQSNKTVEIIIEKMQPYCLQSDQLKNRYFLTTILLNILIIGISAGLIGWEQYLDFWLIAWHMSLLNFGLCVGLFYGLYYCFIEIQLIEAFNISTLSRAMHGIFHNSFVWMMTTAYGLICIFAIWVNPNHIFDVIVQLFPSISIALIGSLIFGIKQELNIRTRPNQGIWNSLQSAILLGTMMFFPNILNLLIMDMLHLWKNILILAIISGIWLGGGSCLQHLSLRIVLWQSGLPWNFARFLNYCVERRLLLRVGGRYRFLHRELLDHFAQPSR